MRLIPVGPLEMVPLSGTKDWCQVGGQFCVSMPQGHPVQVRLSITHPTGVAETKEFTVVKNQSTLFLLADNHVACSWTRVPFEVDAYRLVGEYNDVSQKIVETTRTTAFYQARLEMHDTQHGVDAQSELSRRDGQHELLEKRMDRLEWAILELRNKEEKCSRRHKSELEEIETRYKRRWQERVQALEAQIKAQKEQAEAEKKEFRAELAKWEERARKWDALDAQLSAVSEGLSNLQDRTEETAAKVSVGLVNDLDKLKAEWESMQKTSESLYKRQSYMGFQQGCMDSWIEKLEQVSVGLVNDLDKLKAEWESMQKTSESLCKRQSYMAFQQGCMDSRIEKLEQRPTISVPSPRPSRYEADVDSVVLEPKRIPFAEAPRMGQLMDRRPPKFDPNDASTWKPYFSNLTTPEAVERRIRDLYWDGGYPRAEGTRSIFQSFKEWLVAAISDRTGTLWLDKAEAGRRMSLRLFFRANNVKNMSEDFFIKQCRQSERMNLDTVNSILYSKSTGGG